MTPEEKIQRISDAVGVDRKDWFKCLNAMHDAENIVPNPYLYVEKLSDVCLRGVERCGLWTPTSIQAVAFATATQRAEAFGLTMGLWKEGE